MRQFNNKIKYFSDVLHIIIFRIITFSLFEYFVKKMNVIGKINLTI